MKYLANALQQNKVSLIRYSSISHMFVSFHLDTHHVEAYQH
jgi:hypothetical protein